MPSRGTPSTENPQFSAITGDTSRESRYLHVLDLREIDWMSSNSKLMGSSRLEAPATSRIQRSIVVASVVYVFCLVVSSSGYCQLNQLETKNLRLVYIGELQTYVVPHVARCFENSLQYHQRFFDFTPSEKVTVFLHDFMDYGNAGASTAPRNRLAVAVAPISYTFETTPANERMNSTLHHELVHIVASDQAIGSDRFFRQVFFGKVQETSDNPMSILYSYLTTPRRSAPRWYHEGIAVFMETWMTGGLGRALGPWDEMVFRTKILEGARIYDWVGLQSEGMRIDFQVGVNAYLYGGRFVSYVALTYGPEMVVEWIKRTGGSKGYYISQFHHVFGRHMADAWHDWIEWERTFQNENLDSILAYPLSTLTPVTENALGSVSRAYFDRSRNRIITAVNYPGTVPHIAAIDMSNGESRKLCDVKDAALYFVCGLAYDPESQTAFYTTDNNGWRDLVTYNIESGKSSVVLKDGRVGDLCFSASDDAVWGVRHDNGISTLVRIPHPYNQWNQVLSWDYGRDIYDIDISHDGTLLSASLAEIDGQQRLILMNVDSLLAGNTSYRVLHDYGNSTPESFVFSDDDNFLFGSSYYTGVSNIFRYDLTLDSMEALSNVESGLFRPVPLDSTTLLAFSYTDKGFIPVTLPIEPIEDINPIRYLGQEIVKIHPVVKSWKAAPPSSVDLDSMTVSQGVYRGFPRIRIVTAYPIVEGYKDLAAVGMRFDFAEPLNLHHGDFSVSYTPDQALAEDERFHAGMSYGYLDWDFHAQYNGADFYDLFGPTKSSRKGYSAGITMKKTLIYDQPRELSYQLNLTGYGGLERLPGYQNIATTYTDFAVVSALLGYRNQKASLGAVDYESGSSWSLTGDARYVTREVYPRFWATFARGLPFPIHHSSVWLRLSAGYSPGERANPFANFYFGGFGNNWIDHSDIKQYRRYYSFPGLGLNDIGGTNFTKAILEWNLPPLLFRHLGFSSLFANWVRTSIFASALSTNVDSDNLRQIVANSGIQLDLRVLALSHLNLTFSTGYAFAFQDSFRPTDEWMFSLKIL